MTMTTPPRQSLDSRSSLFPDGSVAGIPFEQLLELESLSGAPDAAAYLSGSLVCGLGNPWSDIDIFVITDRKPVGPFAKEVETNAVSQHYVNERRVDFEFWRPQKVREMARRLAAFELGTCKTIQGTVFLLIEELFIHRLKIGYPLLNSAALREYQALFDFDYFRLYQAEEAIRFADALLEDLCGMMESGDLNVALLLSRDVVNAAIDAYSHWSGNTDPSRKWRLKHLEAAVGRSSRAPDLLEHFWELQFPDARVLRRDEAACRSHLEKAIRFVNRLVSEIQNDPAHQNRRAAN